MYLLDTNTLIFFLSSRAMWPPICNKCLPMRLR